MHERLGSRAIVVGDDFSGAARRSGDMVLLRAQATHFGFAVDAVSSVRLDELRCSSTALREALALPDLAHAAELLGRSEEHTSELQSLMRISYAVFCLQKKKRTKNQHNILIHI